MLTMTKYSAKGASIEQFKSFIDDPVPVAAVLNNRLTPERLDDDEGEMVYHMHFKAPFPVSNRSTVLTYYRVLDGENGCLRLLTSSMGNDEIAASIKKKIGSNVLTDYYIGGSKIIPVEGGVELIQLLAQDLKGSMPTFVQNMVGKRASRNGKYTAEYILHKKVPEQD